MRISSCLELYSPLWRVCSTWIRVWCWPHRLQFGCDSLLRRYRLELCGKLSANEFIACKLKTLSGRVVMVLDHEWGSGGVVFQGDSAWKHGAVWQLCLCIHCLDAFIYPVTKLLCRNSRAFAHGLDHMVWRWSSGELILSLSPVMQWPWQEGLLSMCRQ